MSHNSDDKPDVVTIIPKRRYLAGRWPDTSAPITVRYTDRVEQALEKGHAERITGLDNFEPIFSDNYHLYFGTNKEVVEYYSSELDRFVIGEGETGGPILSIDPETKTAHTTALESESIRADTAFVDSNRVLTTADEGSLDAGSLQGLVPAEIATRQWVKEYTEDSVNTHVSVFNNGSSLLPDPDVLDFGDGLKVSVADGTAKISATAASDTHTNVSDSGVRVGRDVSDINFGQDLSVANEGNGRVTVEYTGFGGSDTRANISDDGVNVVKNVTDINFTDNLSVVDDGDDSVTIASTDTQFSGSHDDLTDVSSDDHHNRYTDSEAISAINADADHGSTASHDYFSGSHTDLTNIASDDHHTRYSDTEAVSAINSDPDHATSASHNYFSGSHNDLFNVASDDHHTKTTPVGISDDSTPVHSETGGINFGDNLSVTDDGDGTVTIDSTDTIDGGDAETLDGLDSDAFWQKSERVNAYSLGNRDSSVYAALPDDETVSGNWNFTGETAWGDGTGNSIVIQGTQIRTADSGKVLDFSGGLFTFQDGFDIRGDSRIHDDHFFSYGTDRDYRYSYDSASGNLLVTDSTGTTLAEYSSSGVEFPTGLSKGGSDVLTTADEGSLDAGTLDGENSSAFADASHSHGTGDLTFDPATQSELDTHASDASAHHARYNDSEAVAAVEGTVDVATLTSSTASSVGQAAVANDSGGVDWVDIGTQAEIDAHTSDTSNPHDVTAAQTGSIPDSAGTVTSDHIVDGTLALTDLGFDPATQSELNSHEGVSDAHHAKYTDSEAISAINADVDHGSTASHNYFSESHDDLTDVSSDDHHSRYTDSEAQAALTGHTSDTTNPHEVTAGQTGAITDSAGSVDQSHLNFDTATQSELATHSSDNSAHHSRYSDEEAQDAVGSILGPLLTYDDSSPGISVDEASINHDAISGVSADDHHSRYADSEAISAVEGTVDVASLTSSSASSTGQAAVANGSGGVDWVDIGTQAEIDAHTSNTNNPHNVTAAQTGAIADSTGAVTSDHIADGTLALTDLGFDPATQSELNSHEGDSDAHHAKYTDSEAISAINADADHGSSASHNYFSGSHDDLSGVSSDDHHTKTTPVAISDDATEIYPETGGLNFGSNLSVTDDGDGTVTIESTDTNTQFSGSHDDLTNVSSDDHHSRYTDSEARSALSGHTSATNNPHSVTSGQVGAIADAAGSVDQTHLSFDPATQSELSNHTGTTDAHHAKYTDSEARSAVGGSAPWSPGDLSFDPATQSELNSHEGDSDAHHAKYTDSEAISAINADADHGSTASHNYFSESHDDLTDVSSDDHHARYLDSEAVAAVGGTAPWSPGDLTFDPVTEGELNTHSGVTDAHHSRYSDSEAVVAVESAGTIATDISGDAATVDGLNADQFLRSDQPDTTSGTIRSTSETPLVAEGSTSDFSMSVQDGHGRGHIYWNVEPGTQNILTANEGASWLNLDGGNAKLSLAPGQEGDAGAPAQWQEALRLDTNGNTAEVFGEEIARQPDLTSHTSDTSNPHNVTAGQAGALPDSNGSVDESNLSFDIATQAELDTHENDGNAHHSRYSDSEATAAVGGSAPWAVSDLSFDPVTESELNSHSGVADAHHTRYTDSEAQSALSGHTSATNNPHSVTAAQVGAISDADNTVQTNHITTGAVGIPELGFNPATQSELNSHTSATNNPHSVTAAQAGAIADSAGSVDQSHLGFDTATEAELSSHQSNNSAHHARYSDGEAISAIESAHMGRIEGDYFVDGYVTNTSDDAFEVGANGLRHDRIVLQSGTVSFGAMFDSTTIYRNGSKVATANAGDSGSFSASIGDMITADRPTALYQNSNDFVLPPVSWAGQEHIFQSTRSEPHDVKIYAPFGPANIDYYYNTAVTGSRTSSHSVNQEDFITVTLDQEGVHRFVSDSPVLIQKYASDDKILVPPASREVLHAFAENANAMEGGGVPQVGGIYYYSNDGDRVSTTQIADGAGHDAEMGTPYRLCGDAYVVTHDVQDYGIVSVEPNIIGVYEWDSSAGEWSQANRHDHSSASRDNPKMTSVGSKDGSSTEIVATGPVLFLGKAPFALRLNDNNAGEYTAVGFRMSEFDHQSLPYATKADFDSHTGDPNAHHSRYTDSEAQSALSGHTNATDNPHNVTAAQAGALADTSGSVDQSNLSFDPTTQSELNSHESDTDAHHSRYSNSEAVSAINADSDHGSTASHNYFTGSHDDLTSVSSNDHHTKTTPVAISDNTTQIYSETGGINFGSNLSVTDDGDGTVTIDSTDTNTQFSGSHDDLTNVSSNDHHTRYTDSEAQSALSGHTSATNNPHSVTASQVGAIADGTGTVTSSHLADGTITTADLSFDPASQSELNSHEGTADAHHSRFSAGEARNAVTGSVDVADLVSSTATATGQAAVADGTGGVDWVDIGTQAEIDAHTSDMTNPHDVTSGQVGAIADAAGTVTASHLADGSIGTGELSFNPATQSELTSHTGDTTNPHNVTSSQVGALADAAGTVDQSNLSFDPTTQAELTTHAGTADAHHSRYTDSEAQSALSSHTSATDNPHSVSLEQARSIDNQLNGPIRFSEGNHIEFDIEHNGLYQPGATDVIELRGRNGASIHSYDGSSLITDLTTKYGDVTVPNGNLTVSGNIGVDALNAASADVTGPVTADTLTTGKSHTTYATESSDDVNESQGRGMAQVRVIMEDQTHNYATVLPDTTFYKNGEFYYHAEDIESGSFNDVVPGDRIWADKPAAINYASLDYPVPSLSYLGDTFSFHTNRDAPTEIFLYSPYAPADVEIYVDTSPDTGGTPTDTVTVQPGTVELVAVPTTGNFRLYSDAPILAAKTGGSNDDGLCLPPASREVMHTMSKNRVSARPGSSDSTIDGSNPYWYSDEPFSSTQIADGSGTDAEMGTPVKALGDLYILPHDLTDYALGAIEGCTITVYERSGGSWVEYDTHDFTDASRENPRMVEVGSQSGGSGTLSTNTPFLFVADAPFYLRTNGGGEDEYSPIGFRTDEYDHNTVKAVSRSELTAHTDDTSNPHNVTAAQSGAIEDSAGAVDSSHIADGSISTGDLGFDPTTQSELNSHENDGDAHHTRYSDSEAQSAVGGSAPWSTDDLSFDPVQEGEFQDRFDSEMEKHVNRTRSFVIDSSSGVEYYKIAKISSGDQMEQGRFDAQLFFATDNGGEETRMVRVFGAVRTSHYDLQAIEYGSGQGPGNLVDLLVTETDATGSTRNGEPQNEYYLWVRAEDFCQSELQVKYNQAISEGNFDFQNGLTQSDLIGTVVADTQNPTAQMSLGEVDTDTVSSNTVEADESQSNFAIEKQSIETGETRTVPEGHSAVVSGEYVVDGTLVVEGTFTVV